MAAVYYTVKKGDTLSHIAQKYGCTWQFLAKINNLSNPHLIYPGQKILIGGEETSPSTSNPVTQQPAPTYPTVATITSFGLQANTDRTVFAIWSWGRGNTDHYQIYWSYMTDNGVWFTGSDSTTKNTDSTYNAPANATKVRFKVKPVSKTYKSNNKDVSYWTASWSGEKKYEFSANPPSVPPTPTVKVENYNLISELSNINLNAKQIEFQIVKNDRDIFNTAKVNISTNSAKYSCAITAGYNYKVRCRSVRDDLKSEWSDYSSNVGTKPAKPEQLNSAIATSSTSVRLSWTSSDTATSYDIQYSTSKNLLTNSNSATTINNVTVTSYEITGLATGSEYYFRVRAVNDQGTSDWTNMVSTSIGTKPEAPTTWSSTTTAIIGEEVILFWVHNCEDGSTQTNAELEMNIDGVVTKQVLRNDNTEENITQSFVLDTTNLTDGVEVKWKVRTAGVTSEYGDWSIERMIKIYAPVTLQVNVTNNDGNEIEEINSFPFYINCIPGPETQKPISYNISIRSMSTYITMDEVGKIKAINEGETIFSKHYNTDQIMLLEMTPFLVDLENGIEYKITCTVSMNSGLSKTEERTFTVNWSETSYTPNASIAFDKETLSASIKPYCNYIPVEYHRVVNNSGTYVRTNEVIDPIGGIMVDNVLTTMDDIVYSGTYNGSNIYFSIINSDTPILLDNVRLSVYRREYDGSFVEIGRYLENDTTFVTDPHPALDYARYRIVAISEDTGAMGFTDLPGYPIQEKSIVIQWDENWTSYEEINADSFDEAVWNGSMLKLSYNIDISDSNTPDVELVKYLGRNHPVSYYGTQIGNTSTWNVDIPKDDDDTLFMLRRLSNWMGDVYVREPSGSGYWANITVSFSQKHCDTVIPVTLNLTRVVGGV